MPEIVNHRNPQAIWLFDYPSLQSMDDCPMFFVLLSERDINIIWQSVLNIGLIRSRVYNSRQRNNYDIVDIDQFSQFQEWVSDMNVNMGDFMACNGVLEAMLEALERIGSMSNCCGGIEGANGGSSGSGMEPAPPSATEDTEESHGGPPPPGFADWDEFDQKKCDWVNKVLDDMVVDIATMGAVQITIQTATALAAILVPLLVTPVGWVILLEIAVVMIAAAATAGFYGFLSTHMETYRSDYKCALLSGTDVVSSIANFGDAVDTNVAADSNFNALTGYWASSILKSLATVDSINRLYDSQAFAPTTGDCSDCEPVDLFFIDLVGGLPAGALTSGNMLTSGTIESSTIDVFGAIRQVIICTSTGEPQDNFFRIDNVVSNSGSAGYVLNVYAEGPTLIDTVSTGTLEDLNGYESDGCFQFHLFDGGDGTSSFEIEFSWSETPF